MAAIGFDCQVTLDGIGLYIEPTTYTLTRPKVTTSTTTRGTPPAVTPPTSPVTPRTPAEPAKTGTVPQRILDRGPGARVWKFDALCLNSLHRYDGSPLGPIGQQTRDAIHHSYEKVATNLAFVDPNNYTYLVTFTELIEKVNDLRGQIIGLEYILTLTLTEAV